MEKHLRKRASRLVALRGERNAYAATEKEPADV
jgi:hypothetical protein